MTGTLLGRDSKVGVLGAGAMGSGIAQVAAAAGHHVVLVDSSNAAIEKARASLAKNLAREVEKGRMDAARSRDIASRVTFDGSGKVAAFRGCTLVIEAIVEDLAAKKSAFAAIEDVIGKSGVLATNTSSLSVTAIAGACRQSERVIGLHFFNPPTVLPLVEVIGTIASDANIVTDARRLIDAWGKTTVIARDTPGFIVNRVARPFYGESLRIYEEGIADIPTIDWAMKEVGGFRMGPFELMDLIGNDVNYAVTQSVFEGMYFDPRYRPSVTQRRMVESGRLGRKTSLGYYDYRDGAEKPAPRTDRAVGQRIVDRVLAMLINEAADALHFRIASADDIELAMTKGVNYPKGLLAWADEIGVAEVHRRLTALHEEYGEDRYRPSPMLKAVVRDGRRFLGRNS